MSALARRRQPIRALLEDVKMPGGQFRNFGGEKRKYNAQGDRNFVIFLPDAQAESMQREGWNIKLLKPRPDDEDQRFQPYLRVAIGYKIKPPTVGVLSSRGRTDLGEAELEVLDWMEFAKVDLIINGSPYKLDDGTEGYKCWLKSLFVTINEDELQLKYADVEYAELTVDPAPLELNRGSQEFDDTHDIVDAEIIED